MTVYCIDELGQMSSPYQVPWNTRLITDYHIYPKYADIKQKERKILGFHVKAEERIGLHMTCIYMRSLTKKKKMFMKSKADCR